MAKRKTKLKKCPFCESKVNINTAGFGQVGKRDVFTLYFFDCMNFKCEISVLIHAKNKQSAIAIWNKRNDHSKK
jgi:hypothetical protein